MLDLHAHLLGPFGPSIGYSFNDQLILFIKTSIRGTFHACKWIIKVSNQLKCVAKFFFFIIYNGCLIRWCWKGMPVKSIIVYNCVHHLSKHSMDQGFCLPSIFILCIYGLTNFCTTHSRDWFGLKFNALILLSGMTWSST